MSWVSFPKFISEVFFNQEKRSEFLLKKGGFVNRIELNWHSDELFIPTATEKVMCYGPYIIY
jgi:hypothetical protein